MIETIKKQSFSDIVAENMQENIIQGKWPADSKIPSETELSAMYGVNRSTIRSALQRLNAMGFIETRMGEGSFVRRLDLADHLSNISGLYLTDVQEQSINEYRNIIETGAAKLAMERATEEEIAELERRYNDYENESIKIWPLIEQNHPDAEEAYKQVALYDLAFHEQIVIMSHNEFLRYAFSLIHNSISVHIVVLSIRRLTKVKGGDTTRFLETRSSHKRQLEAIKNKDYSAFCDAYDLMIDINF